MLHLIFLVLRRMVYAQELKLNHVNPACNPQSSKSSRLWSLVGKIIIRLNCQSIIQAC